MNLFKFWLNNARPKALPQSVLPAILAVCMASSVNGFSIWLGMLAVLGVIAGHLGLNLFDDYFDYKKKKTDYREHLAHNGFRARIGKCLYLTSGKATIKQLFIASCLFSFVALIIGAIILYYRGSNILYFIIFTAILSISYSGAPLRLSYRGLGELVIGFIFGPLVMTGAFYAACGTITSSVLIMSVPVGLFVANILFVHSIMDFEPDKKIGKRTLAVLLNNPKLMLITLSIILFIPYIIVASGILMNYISVYFSLVFVTLPIAISLFYMMIEYIQNPEHKFTPRFWMGPMTDWNKIQAAGIDWFMIRWYLARNLLTMFCLIIIVLSFL